jgi:hypothetical protein
MSKHKINSNKSFGIVFFLFFLIISIYPLLSNGSINYLFLILSLIFLVLTVLNSKILSPFNKVWFKLGIFLSKIISPLVMGIIFFFVVSPIAILMKILKKDLINLKLNNSKSYWIIRNNENNSMKKQF